MALSDKAKNHLEVALGNTEMMEEIADAIDDGSNPQAEVVEPLGTTTALVGVDGAGSNAAPLTETEARLDAIEAKIDELIGALQTAGLMAE